MSPFSSGPLLLDRGSIARVVTLGNLLPHIDFLLILKSHHHRANYRLVESHAVLKNSWQGSLPLSMDEDVDALGLALHYVGKLPAFPDASLKHRAPV